MTAFLSATNNKVFKNANHCQLGKTEKKNTVTDFKLFIEHDVGNDVSKTSWMFFPGLC